MCVNCLYDLNNILLFQGTLNDETNAIDFLMDKDNVVPRINPLILQSKWQYLNLISTSGKIILPSTFLQMLIELQMFH